MKIIDVGHKYFLKRFDGGGFEQLTFMKREGRNYPGNTNAYPGTNLQEVWRACIQRLQYLHAQIPCPEDQIIIGMLRTCISLLEARAAERHGRSLPRELQTSNVEIFETCDHCGHLGCDVGPYS